MTSEACLFEWQGQNQMDIRCNTQSFAFNSHVNDSSLSQKPLFSPSKPLFPLHRPGDDYDDYEERCPRCNSTYISLPGMNDFSKCNTCGCEF